MNTPDTLTNHDEEPSTTDRRAVARAALEAEIRAWKEATESLKRQLTGYTDELRDRMNELADRFQDQDPALAARFRGFTEAARRAENVYQDALVEAWGEAHHALTTASQTELLAAGEMAPASGQYEILDGEGRPTGEERTAVQGRPLPPTPEPGQSYRLVDPTRNQAGVPN